MKLTNFFPIVLVLLINCQLLFSQEKDSGLVLIDSISEINYEFLAFRLDSLISGLKQVPEHSGYIVLYGGSNPVENIFVRNTAANFIKLSGLNSKKLSLVTAAGDSNNPKFEFWSGRNGERPKVEKIDFPLTLPADKPINFVSSLIQLVKIDGKQSYIEIGCDAGCFRNLNFYLLSDFLESNPHSNAYVIVHATSPNRARQVKRVLAEDAVKNAGIPPNRLIFFHGGKNKVNGPRLSEIEIYLSPNKLILPKSAFTLSAIF